MAYTTIQQKAQNIKLFAMDVDGVLTDGKIIYNSDGTETKAFFVQDGVGIHALHTCGIMTAIITGRLSPMVERRAKELGIQHVIQGRDDKFVALSELAQHLELSLDECAYMGDDLPDVKAIRLAGLGLSVPNGVKQAKDSADMVTLAQGGHGAVREVCEFILMAQHKFDDYLQKFLSDKA